MGNGVGCMNKETLIQQKILLKIGSREDCRFFRNNVGMAYRANGVPIKFGVCNPGGSDLIGWRSIIVTEKMIGKKIAVFSAIEVKSTGKKATAKQKNFISQVKKNGGIAGVAYDPEEADALIDLF